MHFRSNHELAKFTAFHCSSSDIKSNMHVDSIKYSEVLQIIMNVLLLLLLLHVHLQMGNDQQTTRS